MKELHNPDFGEIGYIQVYTGDGKGKTTASLGLSLRALGRGWSVLIVMFTKGGDDYGELRSFSNLSPELKRRFKIVNAGMDKVLFHSNLTDTDRLEAKKGWEYAKKAINSGKFQLVVLDEINIVLDMELIELDDVLETLKNKPKNIEIVLTGRNAKEEIKKIAHLVSEIKPIKHYWDIGVEARSGIEY